MRVENCKFERIAAVLIVLILLFTFPNSGGPIEQVKGDLSIEIDPETQYYRNETFSLSPQLGASTGISTLKYGQEVLYELEPSGEIDLNFSGWYKAKASNTPHFKDCFDISKALGTDRLMMFGGGQNGYNSDYDTWVYDLSTNSWEQYYYGVQPDHRSSYGLAPVYGSSDILLYGGYKGTEFSGDTPWSDQTWLYHMGTNAWEILDPVLKPEPRLGMGVAPIDTSSKILMFGGYTTEDDNTYLFDIYSKQWGILSDVRQGPHPRNSQVFSRISEDDKVVMFGGVYHDLLASTFDITYNETWVFDLSESTWTNMSPPVHPSNRSRCMYGSIPGDDKIILTGGEGCPYEESNETWIYDLSENNWTKLNLTSGLGPKSLFAMDNVHGTRKFVLFSTDSWTYGRDAEVEGNDTWILDLDSYPSQGEIDSQVIEVGSDAIFRRLKMDINIPPGTQVRYQVKSGTEADIFVSDFVGPDGTENTYYVVGEDNIDARHQGDEFVQFRIILNTTDDHRTPIVSNIRLHIDKITKNAIPSIEVRDIPPEVGGNRTPIEFILTDDDSDRIDVHVEYSLNGTGFQIADMGNGKVPTRGKESSPDGVLHRANWYVEMDLGEIDLEGVWLRFRAFDHRFTQWITLGPFHVDTYHLNLISYTPNRSNEYSRTIDPIILEFDDDVDPSTVSFGSIRVTYNHGYHAMSGSYEVNGNLVKFIMVEPLPFDERIEVIVMDSVADTTCNPMRYERTFTYQTQSNDPMIITSFSVSGGIDSADLEPEITVDLSTPINTTYSDIEEIRLTNEEGYPVEIEFAISGTELRIVPLIQLEEGMDYRLHISNRMIVDYEGNTLEGYHELEFTTYEPPPPWYKRFEILVPMFLLTFLLVLFLGLSLGYVLIKRGTPKNEEE